MNCPKCNRNISEGAPFCAECGAAIVAASEPVARRAPQGAAARVEVDQHVGTVEGGRVVGVDLRVLAALAAPVGASLKARRVSALAGLWSADARPELDSLQRRGLVQEDDRGYMLAGSLEEQLRRSQDLTPWADRALEHFATWAQRHLEDVEALTEEADSLLGILEWGAEAGHWAEVLRLGRAVEGALAVGGQWGAWERVLGWELEAARALGDRAAEGWALHQLGTRALCLEDTPAARADLTEALRSRETLGDWEGAAVTRHNLRLLGGFGTDQGPEGDGGGVGSTWLKPGLWLGMIAFVSALALFLTALVIGKSGGPEPTPSSLTLDRSEVEAGETVRGTVTLSNPAPPGGVAVSLSSSKPKVARVKSSVIIEEEKRSGTFTVSTSAMSASSISTLPISHHGKYLLVAFQDDVRDYCPNGDSSGDYYDGVCGEPTDYCPNGDSSGDYYDGVCGERPMTEDPGTQPSGQGQEEGTQPSGQGQEEGTQPFGQGQEEGTQPPMKRSRKQTVEVTITASVKGVEQSKTLTVRGVQ